MGAGLADAGATRAVWFPGAHGFTRACGLSETGLSSAPTLACAKVDGDPGGNAQGDPGFDPGRGDGGDFCTRLASVLRPHSLVAPPGAAAGALLRVDAESGALRATGNSMALRASCTSEGAQAAVVMRRLSFSFSERSWRFSDTSRSCCRRSVGSSTSNGRDACASTSSVSCPGGVAAAAATVVGDTPWLWRRSFSTGSKPTLSGSWSWPQRGVRLGQTCTAGPSELGECSLVSSSWGSMSSEIERTAGRNFGRSSSSNGGLYGSLPSVICCQMGIRAS
mmetsp:Transcript_75637/g.214008  ORF Transcript_75637/g.214008 Transcript_75637/m.214008 type:complete len:279 (-) Transcript_75637:119-955(-)